MRKPAAVTIHLAWILTVVLTGGGTVTPVFATPVDYVLSGGDLNGGTFTYDPALIASFTAWNLTFPADIGGSGAPTASFLCPTVSCASANDTATNLEFTPNFVDRYELIFNESALTYSVSVELDSIFDGNGGSAVPVPEPASLLLLGSGLVGLAAQRRRKLTA